MCTRVIRGEDCEDYESRRISLFQVSGGPSKVADVVGMRERTLGEIRKENHQTPCRPLAAMPSRSASQQRGPAHSQARVGAGICRPLQASAGRSSAGQSMAPRDWPTAAMGTDPSLPRACQRERFLRIRRPTPAKAPSVVGPNAIVHSTSTQYYSTRQYRQFQLRKGGEIRFLQLPLSGRCHFLETGRSSC